MRTRNRLDKLSQFAIPLLTALGYFLTSLKYPEWGLVVSLLAQPFWLLSSYKAYRTAGQIGLFVNSVIMTFVIAFGIINYWLF